MTGYPAWSRPRAILIPVLLPLATIVFLTVFGGCTTALEVPFVGDDGTETTILAGDREEGSPASTEAGVVTLHYKLKRSVEASAERDFALRVDVGTVVHRIDLLDEEGAFVASRELTSVADTTAPREYRVEVPEGVPVAGFAVHVARAGLSSSDASSDAAGRPGASGRPDANSSDPSGRQDDEAVFTFAGFRPSVPGFATEDGHLVVGTAVRRVSGAPSSETTRDALVSLDLPEASIVELRYSLDPVADTSAPESGAPPLPQVALRVFCGSDQSTGDASLPDPGDPAFPTAAAEFTMTLRPGDRSVYLHRAALGCAPTTLLLPEFPAQARIEGVTPVAPAGRDHAPIPADMGVILEHYPQERWRRAEYELFSWNLYPEILIFDIRSYEIQSRFFKRLAFFVEKRGYRGELMTNSELSALHGWNAHNYRPEGLADFFNRAAAEGFQLNAEELLLKEILLANGVLLDDAGGGEAVLPGDGGILTVSQESSPILRELLMTHEAFHGIFYANRAFREGVFAQWEDLTVEEREYWRALLSFLTYDPADRYLMVNEFQGYLLQQPEERVRGYFRGTLAGRLARRRGTTFVNEFLAAHPTTFEAAARRVNRLALETAGVVGGDVYCLR